MVFASQGGRHLQLLGDDIRYPAEKLKDVKQFDRFRPSLHDSSDSQEVE